MSVGILILVGTVVALAAFLAFVASRPAEFRIERSIALEAPPSSIFPHVNDLRRWSSWSPWEGMDPALKRAYEGADAGVGAVYHYSGNNKVGEGRMTIRKSEPSSRVELELQFLRPFVATNTAVFEFASEGGKTKVTWAMEGKNSFAFKLFGLVFDSEKLVGRDFEKGLAKLKELVESGGNTAA